MDSISVDDDTETVELSAEQTGNPESDYYKRFDLEVGQVRVEIGNTGDCEWMWKAETSDGVTNVSSSPMDAVMGCLEEQTGGVV